MLRRTSPRSKDTLTSPITLSQPAPKPKMQKKIPPKTLPQPSSSSKDSSELSFVKCAERYLEAINGSCIGKSITDVIHILKDTSLKVAKLSMDSPSQDVKRCARLNTLINEVIHEYLRDKDASIAHASLLEVVLRVCNEVE